MNYKLFVMIFSFVGMTIGYLLFTWGVFHHNLIDLVEGGFFILLNRPTDD